jgi:hypothetical protein
MIYYHATTRANGFILCSFTLASSATIREPAPSEIPEAVPIIQEIKHYINMHIRRENIYC